MDLNRLKAEPFVSTAQKKRQRAMRVRIGRAANPRAGSMMTKISLCLLLLVAALIVRLIYPPEESIAASVTLAQEESVNGEEEDGGNEDETLGRLRFVQADGIMSVFGSGAQWSQPVQATDMAFSEQDGRLTLYAAEGESVLACAAGEVRAMGSDDELGDYIRINHGGDIESVYYGLNGIRVEQGQPIRAGDTLGTVSTDACIVLVIYAQGEPQDPSSYLAISVQN